MNVSIEAKSRPQMPAFSRSACTSSLFIESYAPATSQHTSAMPLAYRFYRFYRCNRFLRSGYSTVRTTHSHYNRLVFLDISRTPTRLLHNKWKQEAVTIKTLCCAATIVSEHPILTEMEHEIDGVESDEVSMTSQEDLLPGKTTLRSRGEHYKCFCSKAFSSKMFLSGDFFQQVGLFEDKNGTVLGQHHNYPPYGERLTCSPLMRKSWQQASSRPHASLLNT
jgi:hypothetical protein